MFDPSRPQEILTLVASSVSRASSPCLPLVAGVLPQRLEILDVADAAHPSEVLLGLDAPPRWHAVLVAAGGTATHACGRRQAVLAAVLVDRAGRAATLLRADGAHPSLGPGADGSLADACRRSLGLATPPPPSSPVPRQSVWLDRIMSAAAVGQVGWDDLVGLRLPADLSWAGLRGLAADGAESAAVVAAGLAAWMDDGMFARHVLAGLPDPAVLRADLAELLAPATAARLDLELRLTGSVMR